MDVYGCRRTASKVPDGRSKRPIDRQKELEKAVLKWMPHDPCGKEELERPFETDICVSMMMEIGEQEVIADVDCVRTDSTSE